MKQIYVLRFPFSTKKDSIVYRPPKINQDRDGWATHLLVEMLRGSGDVLIAGFNTDAADLSKESVTNRLFKGDLILTTTRFGMDDVRDNVRTPVLSGSNWLEEPVIVTLSGISVPVG